MINMEGYKPYLSSHINKYGKMAQIDIALEELIELAKELLKAKRGKYQTNDIIEMVDEIADVHIMLQQLQLIFEISDKYVEDIIFQKIDRMKKIYGDNE